MVLVLGVVLAATRAGFCRIDSIGYIVCSFVLMLVQIRCCSHASTLRGVRRPNGGLNAELLCVLGVQSLPAVELHGFGADDASNGLTRQKPIQHIETNVPPGSTH